MLERKRHRKASEVFKEAIDRPESERDAYVTAACAGDDNLEREVRSLLRYDVPDSQAPTEPAPDGPIEPRDMTGQTVGRYRIVSVLGRGGMGIVWKAEDPVLGRFVAIKFLPQAQAKYDVARRRFLRESRAASILSHPGIATVFDVGEVDEEPYIAMQFVEGQTVRDRLKQQPFSPAEAVRIAMRAAEALQHAHSKGVIHRDVTSSNVMVQNDGTVVVLDFGVARRSADDTRLSRTGEIVGTIGYIAPEIIRGDDATEQSDVFSLGVVFYEMLTGHMPFTGWNAAYVVKATLEADPEPPSRFVHGVPTDADRILATALARDLGLRYQKIHRMVDDLGAVLKDEELSRYPRAATRPPRDRSAASRNRRRNLIYLLAALAVTAIIFYYLIRKP